VVKLVRVDERVVVVNLVLRVGLLVVVRLVGADELVVLVELVLVLVVELVVEEELVQVVCALTVFCCRVTAAVRAYSPPLFVAPVLTVIEA